MEFSDKDLVHLLKNLVKEQALKALKGCVGKPFQYYRDTLVRRYRGPGAKWKRLGQLGRIFQRPQDNVDQFYQYLKS